MEVIDDIGVAQLMKRTGGKCALYNARDALALYFYRSVGEMMRGMEKNGYSAFGQLHLGRALGLFVMFALIELGPVIALALPSAPLPVKQAAGALLVGAVMLQVALARWGGRSMVPALVPCVGAVLFVGCMMRAVILTEVHGGVQWRGTRYTLKQLREGARVKP
jgi:hypothetical protein